ncbi:MAG TPA: CBS domain-containing protein [Gemmatimonadaceae bacterium]|nr:CBS domain-containing protein [Gemmatimonadaceae bacterium]
MLLLRDIMTSEVVTMSPELGIRDAMTILAGRHLGGAPVVASGKVIGIVSATDLMDFAASLPGVPRERIDQAEADGWEELPGWEEGNEPPASFFTEMWADAGAEVEERFAEPGGPEWNALEEHTVGEAMSRGSICALAPGAPVSEAAGYMRRAGVHRILVMEGDRLLGVVTTMDIARAVADHKLTTKVFVFGDRAAPDERGWAIPTEAVDSGEIEEDRTAPGSAELPSGELEEERTTPTTPDETY